VGLKVQLGCGPVIGVALVNKDHAKAVVIKTMSFAGLNAINQGSGFKEVFNGALALLVIPVHRVKRHAHRLSVCPRGCARRDNRSLSDHGNSLSSQSMLAVSIASGAGRSSSTHSQRPWYLDEPSIAGTRCRTTLGAGGCAGRADPGPPSSLAASPFQRTRGSYSVLCPHVGSDLTRTQI